MMLASGTVYKITNVVGETVLSLPEDTHRDNAIIGNSDSDHQNPNDPKQRWLFSHQRQGWTIKSQAIDRFLGIAKTENGAALLARQEPTYWEIEKDSDDLSVWRFFLQGVKDPQYCLDLSDHGNKTPGTPVTIWSQTHGKNQTWKLHAQN